MSRFPKMNPRIELVYFHEKVKVQNLPHRGVSRARLKRKARRGGGTRGKSVVGGMVKGEVNAPVAAGPKRVLGLLSNGDVHRVRTGNLPPRSQITDIGRGQRLGAHPSRFNSGERDLEIDYLRTYSGVLEPSPNRKALPNKSLRADLINVIAYGGFPLELNTSDFQLKSIVQGSIAKADAPQV